MDTILFLEKAKKAIEEKKGLDIVVIKVSEIAPHMDYLLICSGTSDRHVISIAENIKSKLKKSAKPFSIEGLQYGNWVLLDYGWVIFHVFKEEVRTFYQLEDLWKEGSFIKLS